jgi:hypothetical protein
MAKGRRGWNLTGPNKPAVPAGEDHYAWKGDTAKAGTKRQRAQRAFQLGQCERCDVPATDRHHKDGNTGNNDPSNIMILCRRCHMEIDGRLNAFVAKAPTARPRTEASPCEHCGRDYKPLRKGLCAACSQYQRVHGGPRPLDGSFAPRRKTEAGNAGKTHCDHGHPFDGANTYVDKRGRRHCRACGAARKKAARISGETGFEETLDAVRG